MKFIDNTDFHKVRDTTEKKWMTRDLMKSPQTVQKIYCKCCNKPKGIPCLSTTDSIEELVL